MADLQFIHEVDRLDYEKTEKTETIMGSALSKLCQNISMKRDLFTYLDPNHTSLQYNS